jgi:hypothetical protein
MILSIYVRPYIYIHIQRERENMIIIVGLSEGTTGRQERKRDDK